MADSSGNRKDQFRYIGETTSNISEAIQEFFTGNWRSCRSNNGIAKSVKFSHYLT